MTKPFIYLILKSMKRGKFSSGTAFSIIFFFLGASAAVSAEIPDESKKSGREWPEKVLLSIYKEVLDLGFRENENFIKGEFHFDVDGREDNREEHIVFIINPYYDSHKFILQVTYFEAGVRIGSGRAASEYKEMTGFIKKSHVKISKSGFTPEEAGSLFPAILAGIQEEKKLYELIKK